jgi:hypothetical protein
MAKGKNCGLAAKEEAARNAIRDVLQRGPLTSDEAIEFERESHNSMCQFFRERGKEFEDYFLFENQSEEEGHRRAFAVAYIERELPASPVRDYVVHILRQSLPFSGRALRPRGYRDWAILVAVRRAERLGLNVYRNRATRDNRGRHSACSLVADELRKFDIHLSEDAVEAIYRGQLRYVPVRPASEN